MGNTMSVTLHWICGCTFGIEMTTGQVNDFPIGYLLVDVLFVRVQFAWYIG